MDLGETYLNDHGCKDFIQAISSVMKNDLHKQITSRRTFLFSLMADQAVDSGVIEEEILFIRTLENGLVQNRYATIQPVENSDANGVLTSIGKGLHDIGVNNWKDGLVACVTWCICYDWSEKWYCCKTETGCTMAYWDSLCGTQVRISNS